MLWHLPNFDTAADVASVSTSEPASAPQNIESTAADQTSVVSTTQPASVPQSTEIKTEKLITNDLETSWALLAENLTIKSGTSSPNRR